MQKNRLKFRLVLLLIGICFFQSEAFTQEHYLMVLDLQEFNKKTARLDTSVKKMIENVNTMIAYFKPENVIYIQSAGQAISISKKGILSYTTPPPDFDPDLHVVSDHIFIKTEGDAFTSPYLIPYLEKNKVKHIVLVGLMADKCVYHTAIGGKNAGFQITVIPEGIVGSGEKKKEKALKKMKEEGIIITPMHIFMEERN